MVRRRVKELPYDFFKEGISEKLEVYQEFLKQHQVTDEQVCYIGDDFPDLGILNQVGFSVAVGDARDEVKAVSDYITIAPGGRGAVREVIDKVLKGQEKLYLLAKEYQTK